MSRSGILVYIIVIAGIVALTAHQVSEAGAYLVVTHSSKVVALGVVGWSTATFGPLTLSIFAWLQSQRKKPKWLWHVLFIPSAIVLYKVGASILFFAADVPDGDSIEGYTLIIAFGLLGLTLLVHGIAALWFAMRRTKPSGG